MEREISRQRAEIARRELLIATLPEAFIVTSSCIETDGTRKFRFRPNEGFSPKNREAEILTGMQGWVWIDPASERIAKIEGELFRDVSFGWGILGRLHKGGRFKIVQSEIRPGVWKITTLNLDFTGRVLLFKSLRIFQKETASHFVENPTGFDARTAVPQLLSQKSSSLQAHRQNQSAQE